jgi:hypothetical protein
MGSGGMEGHQRQLAILQALLANLKGDEEG